jgi:hypothetical protein
VGELATRFSEFCRSIAGSEELDEILTPEQRALGLKCADFLFAHRSIICEIKALETDTAGKFIAFLRSQELKLTPGEYDVWELLAPRPNGRQLFDRATSLITTAVSDGLAEANRQIRDTRTTLGLPAADGVVVVLNGLIEAVGPQLVVKRVHERFAKSREDGRPYHSEIALVLYFSEKHLRETGSGESAAVTIEMVNPRVQATGDLRSFAMALARGWAAYNGRWFEEESWNVRT